VNVCPEIDIKGTALLIIDMMNDHVHPEGVSSRYFGGLTANDREMLIASNRRLLVAARCMDIPVIHVRGEIRWDMLDSSTAEARLRKRPRHPSDVPFKIKGSWGAQIIDELAPEEREFIIIKKGHSGFGFSELDQILRRLDVKLCITTGGAATGCLSDTIRQGVAFGYDFVMVSDAIYRPNHPVLFALERYAVKCTTEEVLAALDAARS
jgi:ureidoacrylate peracid hydrolase